MGGVLALAAPPLLVALFIWLAQPSDDMPLGIVIPWLVQLFVVFGVGLIGIFVLPLMATSRAVLAAIYIPLAAIGNIAVGLWISCDFYGGCL